MSNDFEYFDFCGEKDFSFTVNPLSFITKESISGFNGKNITFTPPSTTLFAETTNITLTVSMKNQDFKYSNI